MPDYITLMGAEQVQSAGRTISGAADTMSQAALNMDGAFERHQRFLDDWLERLQGALERIRPPDIAQVEEPPSEIEPEALPLCEYIFDTGLKCCLTAGHAGDHDDNMPF